jgi:beta-galactosidase GanA
MLYEIRTGKKYAKVIGDAMTFIVDHLDLPNNVWVDLFITSNKDNSCGGSVDMEEDEYGYHHFYVDINNKLLHDEMVVTLFHEMKHVEQTANKRLDRTIWEGKDYGNVAYLDRPWEKEAYEFESRTILLYRNKLRQDVF